VSLQLSGGLDLITALYPVEVLEYLAVAQLVNNFMVIETGELTLTAQRHLLRLAGGAFVYHIGGGIVRLTGKDVADGVRRVGLKFLVFEF